jgi:hypothetical protein
VLYVCYQEYRVDKYFSADTEEDAKVSGERRGFSNSLQANCSLFNLGVDGSDRDSW